VVHLVPGPRRHGVVRFGLALHEALRGLGFAMELRETLPRRLPGRSAHLQFTDRLYGTDARRAARTVVDLAAQAHRDGKRITATLHDLPQRSDGTHFTTRAEGYARIASTLDGVVVSSQHEAELMSDIGFRGMTTVIPLPVTAPRIGTPRLTHPHSVGVFGFIYPGKGHAEILSAMRGLPADVRFTAIGAPSDGHDHLTAELAMSARAQSRSFDVTGHVPDVEVIRMLRDVTVPVAHHRHVSASGSLNSWLAAGRRPLAPATRYTREFVARNPGGVLLYDDDDASLEAAIRVALADPTATWLPEGFSCDPTPDAASRCYASFLSEVHR
jgi:glycosyltransferase involved in cell wall biosynthesis